jgi:PIN domain nuclease of toxin-antitoxin system
MRTLLDTHVLLWWLDDNERLSSRHRAVIEATETDPWVSAASIWEMSIKAKRGLLEIDGDLVGSIRASHLSILPINESHGWAAGLLPQHHSDPFDRMLVAQGQIEGMIIATVDKVFDLYDVATI